LLSHLHNPPANYVVFRELSVWVVLEEIDRLRACGVDQLLCEPARRSPEKRFIVAGPQYPKTLRWPGNVRRIVHLNPR